MHGAQHGAHAEPTSDSEMDFSLSRITRLLQHLGAPHTRYPVVHVAGTNGKGSVTAYIASVLAAASPGPGRPQSLKVGRFNSPHLVEPRDSIRINGKPLDPHLWDASRARVREADIGNSIGATEFELLASTAFDSFAQEKVDVAVVEVGLGGRLDATNVFEAPIVSVITSIGMDHMAQLGDSVEKIAAEKAGIIKKDRPVVLGPQPFGGHIVANVVRERAAECGAGPVVEVNSLPEYLAMESDEPRNGIPSAKRARFTFLGEAFEFDMPLRGAIQLENVATAIKALELVHQHAEEAKDGRFSLSSADVASGIARTQWPGRLQWIDDPALGVLLVDGAHNQQACDALRNYVDEVLEERGILSEGEADDRVVWVMGVTQGKDVDGILSTLLRSQDMLLTTSFSTPEGMPWIKCTPPEEIALASKMVSPSVRATAYEDLGSCLDALASFKKNRPLCVICGSLYLVADVFRLRGFQV